MTSKRKGDEKATPLKGHGPDMPGMYADGEFQKDPNKKISFEEAAGEEADKATEGQQTQAAASSSNPAQVPAGTPDDKMGETGDISLTAELETLMSQTPFQAKGPTQTPDAKLRRTQSPAARYTKDVEQAKAEMDIDLSQSPPNTQDPKDPPPDLSHMNAEQKLEHLAKETHELKKKLARHETSISDLDHASTSHEQMLMRDLRERRIAEEKRANRQYDLLGFPQEANERAKEEYLDWILKKANLYMGSIMSKEVIKDSRNRATETHRIEFKELGLKPKIHEVFKNSDFDYYEGGWWFGWKVTGRWTESPTQLLVRKALNSIWQALKKAYGEESLYHEVDGLELDHRFASILYKKSSYPMIQVLLDENRADPKMLIYSSPGAPHSQTEFSKLLEDQFLDEHSGERRRDNERRTATRGDLPKVPHDAPPPQDLYRRSYRPMTELVKDFPEYAEKLRLHSEKRMADRSAKREKGKGRGKGKGKGNKGNKGKQKGKGKEKGEGQGKGNEEQQEEWQWNQGNWNQGGQNRWQNWDP